MKVRNDKRSHKKRSNTKTEINNNNINFLNTGEKQEKLKHHPKHPSKARKTIYHSKPEVRKPKSKSKSPRPNKAN
jgi:hypothetical protein